MSSSLTAPSDKTTKFVPTKAVLNEDEVKEAVGVLSKDIRFVQVEQHYADPPQFGQKICLVSFIPSKGAKPDKDNIYGMMKVRGVYATEEEANERAEYIIANIDSYHEIYHCHVGRPFPITTSDVFSNEIKSIDIKILFQKIFLHRNATIASKSMKSSNEKKHYLMNPTRPSRMNLWIRLNATSPSK
jgi:hypothetical protein